MYFEQHENLHSNWKQQYQDYKIYEENEQIMNFEIKRAYKSKQNKETRKKISDNETHTHTQQ